MSEGVGDVFQKDTKYVLGQSFRRFLSWSTKPQTYKSYPVEKIPLAVDFDVKSRAHMPLSEVIKNRKSIRRFSSKPLSFAELSYLLWASTGIRKQNNPHQFRTAPSAGALYPIETYVAANNIQTLTQGLYHYNIEHNALEQLQTGNFSDALTQAALNQEMCSEAPAVLIWTAVFPRQKWKYQQRAYRYVYIDAGHIAQNLALAATSLELGTCQIGAFYDDQINQLLQVDGTNESTIYLSVTGQPLRL
ncbi:MAG: SagB/ThcOx family dehydrogenase [Candidatus Bathyarchaeota archaeon]|nr:SagB/ThcOx family dehydrogenase [Candidatus Bathyarchaeota archaeon]